MSCFIGRASESCDSTLETFGKLEAGGRHENALLLGSQNVLPTRIKVKLQGALGKSATSASSGRRIWSVPRDASQKATVD